MGEVVEVGSAVTKLKKGDRVVVPFTISCGDCFFCKKQLFSCCDTSNPNAEDGRKGDGPLARGLFGYSHMLGGFAGGQAEYLRVPYADVGPLKIESDLPDEKVLFLSDIFPTGYMAAENAEIEPGDTVAVWGCGPVAPVRDPERVDARRRPGDRHRPRARAPRDGRATTGKAETINFDEQTSTTGCRR